MFAYSEWLLSSFSFFFLGAYGSEMSRRLLWKLSLSSSAFSSGVRYRFLLSESGEPSPPLPPPPNKLFLPPCFSWGFFFFLSLSLSSLFSPDRLSFFLFSSSAFSSDISCSPSPSSPAILLLFSSSDSSPYGLSLSCSCPLASDSCPIESAYSSDTPPSSAAPSAPPSALPVAPSAAAAPASPAAAVSPPAAPVPPAFP